MEIGVYYGCDVINLTFLREEFVRENGEGFGVVQVEPIAQRSQNVHHKHETHRDIGSGKPWACEWASEVGRNGGPVKPNCSYAKPV